MKHALTAATIVAMVSFSAPAPAQECRGWEPAVAAPRLKDTAIDESSGLAISRVNTDRLWTHNDSGDAARLFLIDFEGVTHATVVLDGIEARDWEDMAVGPCGPTGTPDNDESCVYVADIGDNLAVWDEVVIHRFREPELAPATTTRVVSEVETVRFSYADGARDAEALMVHPTGRLFIADKVDDGVVRIWEVPPRFGESVTATIVASHTLSESGAYANLATAGDFSPDGTTAVIKTYYHLYTFCGDVDDPVALFQETPVTGRAAALLQGEALAYDASRERIWLTSERLPAIFVYHERVGSESSGADAGGIAEDAGRSDVNDVGTTAPTNDSGDAEAPPDRGPTTGAEKEGCQTASGHPGSAAIFAVLLLSLAFVRRGQRSATHRTSASVPAS